MDFIMPVYVINKVLRQLGLWLLLLSSAVYAESFTVESAQITSIGKGYTLTAKIKYPLTLRVIEALDNGIPITFKQQFELVGSDSLLGKYWPRGLLAELFEPSFELLLELEPPQAVIALTKTAVVNKYSGNFIDISLE